MAHRKLISSIRYLTLFVVAGFAAGFLAMFLTDSWVRAVIAGVIAGVMAGWVSDILGWKMGGGLGRTSTNRNNNSAEGSR
jgi:Na+/proline symporter